MKGAVIGSNEGGIPMAGARLLGASLMLGGILGLAAPQRVDAACLFNCTYTKTRYPIVLAHGLAGFDKLFGSVEYFFGIPGALRDGGATVYVTQVSAYNTPEERGEQLLAQVEQIVAISGSPKVNIIGHSQGGLDARYVAAVRPDLVASVTSVGTPHTTLPLVDAILSSYDTGGVFGGLLRIFGPSIVDLVVLLTDSDQPEDAIAAFRSLSTAALAQFNARYPQGLPTTPCGQGPAVVNGVRYYSWGGTAVVTNPLDASDAFLALFSPLTPGPSDGFVPRCSTHLGQVILDNYLLNHFDEVNQILGLRSLFVVDPRSIYRDHANRLKNAGL